MEKHYPTLYFFFEEMLSSHYSDHDDYIAKLDKIKADIEAHRSRNSDEPYGPLNTHYDYAALDDALENCPNLDLYNIEEGSEHQVFDELHKLNQYSPHAGFQLQKLMNEYFS